MDRSGFLDRFLEILRAHQTRFCVIGGQAVNAYAEPLVSLDLDIAVIAEDAERLLTLLEKQFRVERFAHSVNVSAAGSDLRVQLQLDPRYEPFVARAEPRNILGERLPVGSIEDVLQGKIWALEDDTRRQSKRLKDLADIARLLDAQPSLRSRIPGSILERLT